ncbi:hypothetical protein LO763_01770 [Glycomyces sp. A-F 0318]|uniref:hypothetical protein n=1 Tax=Glycomyces amatae TaxID=2881355 RepID=UPI001E3EBCB6|nr:hypothetical protein [Glycomyces amatae]MCD0442354.1 hypothetical protein [Glycomyces amatae]
MAGDQIVIDNEKILEAAGHYQTLAHEYENVADLVKDAGRVRDYAFGGPFREAWSDYYTLLRNCAYETAANLQAYHRTLEAIVEANELNEAAIESSFADIQDDLLGEGYERSSTQQAEGTAAEDLDAAPDTQLLDMGGEYDAALDPDGTHGNRIVE